MKFFCEGMKIEQIKKNVYRKDIMIAAVTNEVAESTVYALLNGHRTLLPHHLPIIATLEELAAENIRFWNYKEEKFGVSIS